MILVHVEVESGDSVAAVPQSMCGYYSAIRAKHLLPVFPIGLYLHVGFEGIGWSVHQESLWEESLLAFRYPYVGLPALDARIYLEGDNWLGVALSALMKMPEEERARMRADAILKLANSPLDPSRRFLLCECVEAYLPLEGLSLNEYDQLSLTPKYQEARMLGQTSYEKG